jgi:hypothetical protein
MAIINTVSECNPGFGIAAQVPQVLATALSTTGAVANTIPATGTLAQTFRSGKIRIKISSGAGTSPTLAALIVTVTDGTTTELVAAFNPAVAYALGANAVIDLVFTFICDIFANKITVTTTLGGTSPTANMDMEASLEP